MSVHEGVRCDVCGKRNFQSKRFKCLICRDYDLCSTCQEQENTSNDHTVEHPMQCILTPEDFNLYYHGENCTPDQGQSFTCPYCGEMGLAHPFLRQSSLSNNSTSDVDLFQHLQVEHTDDQHSVEVLCPICVTTIGGEPNLATADLIAHIATEHQYPQVNTPSSAGGEISLTARQLLSTRDYDFGIGSRIRSSFRRGLARGLSRRGELGRTDEPVSQSFLADPSSGLPLVGSGNDPVSDLLAHLSAARRLAAASNDGGRTNTSSPNVINLQSLTRHQLERERERLRITGRLHQHSLQQTRQSASASNATPPDENNFFLSLLPSDPMIDPFSSSSSSQQTWAQIVDQQQSNTASAAKTSAITAAELSPSLLRRMCCDSPSLSSVQQNANTIRLCKQKNDFVQCLLVSSFSYPPTEQ